MQSEHVPSRKGPLSKERNDRAGASSARFGTLVEVTQPTRNDITNKQSDSLIFTKANSQTSRHIQSEILYIPLNFLCITARDFVATKYLSASAASSPPIPSSSASTFNTSSGLFGSCCKAGNVS